jgi:hypothetical protein
MIVRDATFDDADEAVELGAKIHAESESKHLAFDPSGAKVIGAQCIVNRSMCAFVAEHEGRIVGVLLGAERSFGYLHARYATDLLFLAKGGAGKLLMTRFKTWAFDERGVDQIIMGVSFGGRSARGSEVIYKRQGFTHAGGIFLMNRGG